MTPATAAPPPGIPRGDWQAQSPFRRAVYAALAAVPPGRVTTYRALAARIGCASARAVGQALRRNPFAPTVPCHRVVRADLSLGGFNGAVAGPEILRKRRLLEAEGVIFDRLGRVTAEACLESPAVHPTPPP